MIFLQNKYQPNVMMLLCALGLFWGSFLTLWLYMIPYLGEQHAFLWYNTSLQEIAPKDLALHSQPKSF